jgi:hypothetical protein
MAVINVFLRRVMASRPVLLVASLFVIVIESARNENEVASDSQGSAAPVQRSTATVHLSVDRAGLNQ